MTTASTSGNYGVDNSTVWVAAIFGALMLTLGVILLFNVGAAVATLVWITGLSLILTGIGELLIAEERTAGDWLAAAALVIGGIVALSWPDATLWVLAVIAGTSLIVTGIVRLATAFMANRTHGWLWNVVAGFATFVAGVLALAWPGATVLVLAIVFGLRMAFTGLTALAIAWELRHEQTSQFAS